MKVLEKNTSDITAPTPKFESRKDFSEFLYEQMVTPTEGSVESFGETRGRPRLLKTYIMEANQMLPDRTEGFGLNIFKEKTALPEIQVLRLQYNNMQAKFFVDTSDPRFWLLHTSSLAKDAQHLFNRLVHSPKAVFDKIWMPTEMIQKVIELPRNSFRGFGLAYKDFFDLDKEEEQAVAELKMRVSGINSINALRALRGAEKIDNSLSYSMVRLRRGDANHYVVNEMGYDGRFTATSGYSIEDYLSLIETTRRIYKNSLETIEHNSLGIKEVEGRTLIEGQAFDLVLKREIENIGSFADILTNSKTPFRIWGLKNNISKEYCQVFGVDLHTGDLLNLEVSDHLIRVYLRKGACGNSVLRLYTNLQHYFDSNIKLNDQPLEIIE